ncbi:MAG: GPR endopeptidase [Lachnospiraceae bacterium]|nr:GPR endopeptidase [Lachnospiraceae bacterium]
MSDETFNIRTDLAVEEQERYASRNVEVPGVKLAESVVSSYGVKITKVEIMDDHGAKAMGRPIGNYVTIEASDMMESKHISSALARELKAMLKKCSPKKIDQMSVLVVGLGNRDVTPDSLGPSVISGLDVNRHIYMLKSKDSSNYGISAVIPGVMAQSGMESAEMVSGIVKQIQPDAVIAIDALAARNTKRLNTTIQLADTGIHPGSGVGNHRQGLNKETLGIPVIAIGIPTVIDAATIVSDAMDALIGVLSTSEALESVSATLKNFSDREKYQLIKELLEPQIGTMFVTPKDIDEDIEIMAGIVASGINTVFRK